MSITPNHFFIRTRKDAFANNPGAHPLVCVKVINGKAFVAVCNYGVDRPSRLEARKWLGDKILRDEGIEIRPNDTLETILSCAGVNSKRRKLLDMDRGSIAFERCLEA